VTTQVGNNQTSNTTATSNANCPTGQKATGGGYQIDKADFAVTKNQPVNSLVNNVSVPTGWTATFQKGASANGSATITAYVICASP
jgi:hypothetical protein